MINNKTPQSIASDLIDAWERIENESMRDGHRSTMEGLIADMIHVVITRFYDEARAEGERIGREKERETVVRWLRNGGSFFAERIERGDHEKGNK